MFIMMASERMVRGVATSAVLCTGLLLSTHADAGRVSTIRGPSGGTWTRSTSHDNDGGGNGGRTATTTRPDGQTASSSASRSVNDGTISTDRAVTGYGGQTATRTMTRTPGQGGSATTVGPNGGTATSSWSH